jgi:hypothetical protein
MKTESIISVASTKDQSYWQRHIDAYNSEGTSKINYCRENNVNYHRFLYWHNKLSKSKGAGALIPVKVKTALPAKAKCTLELNQGCRILIYDEPLALQLLTSVAK